MTSEKPERINIPIAYICPSCRMVMHHRPLEYRPEYEEVLCLNKQCKQLGSTYSVVPRSIVGVSTNPLDMAWDHAMQNQTRNGMSLSIPEIFEPGKWIPIKEIK